jgi:transcriptional regulator
MYLHPLHTFENPLAMIELIATQPLGAWVCHGPQGLMANHLPFLLDHQRGTHGTLVGHVACANPVWRHLGPQQPSVVMFQGPQAYISPSWYPGTAAHGKVVPTWNYSAVHAHGVARAIEDRAWLLAMLRRLTHTHEAAQAAPWRVDDAPAGYVDAMLRAIVGIEIPIDRLEGRLKASQDEALEDRHGTVLGLQQRGGEQDLAMAQQVAAALHKG